MASPAVSHEVAKKWSNNIRNARIENDDKEHFIPNDFLKSSYLQEVAREIFQHNNDKNRLANTVCTRTGKIFAILLFLKKGSDIKFFLDAGISDEHDFPFDRKNEYDSEYHLKTQRGREVDVLMQHWDAQEREEFFKAQEYMKAPLFSIGQEYHLDKCPLPFIKLNTKEREEHTSGRTHEGGYGKVSPAKLHWAHHNFYSEVACFPEKHIIVAVKKLRSTDKNEFDHEVSILKKLRSQEEPHLIRLLAAYSHRGHYYMMFPYARLNLHEYWERNATPICNYEKTLWVFQQISGIASALSRVHIYTADDDYRDRRLQVLNDDQEKRFGRHGDLKPDNILWSHQDQIATVDGKMGVLQIADFGLGRFHGRYSRSNVNPLTLVTSPTYQSPEIELRKPVSRKYDIWSLGCVYLEFASWLLLGWPGVIELADKRAEQNPQTKINDDYFYKLVGDPGSHDCTARLRQGVSSWIASLRKHPQCSEAMFQLLNIIESRMLAIDCAQRVECEKLSMELKNLYDVACENEAFLMNPHGRKEDTREPSPELTRPRQVRSI